MARQYAVRKAVSETDATGRVTLMGAPNSLRLGQLWSLLQNYVGQVAKPANGRAGQRPAPHFCNGILDPKNASERAQSRANSRRNLASRLDCVDNVADPTTGFNTTISAGYGSVAAVG
jgi:hypothetical protein